MTSISLCLAILLTPGIEHDAAHRGCRMAQDFIDSAALFQQDPYVLAAIAWQESNFTPMTIGSSGECGTMQVLPRYSRFTCKQMQEGKGVEAGARALNGWGSAKNVERALYRYNCGYRQLGRCSHYSREVLRKSRSIKKNRPTWAATLES
jgi:soluble lytic murein transglycosylase-like protein